jgi:hypothetical protein
VIERAAKCVTDGFEYEPAVTFETFPKEPIVFRQRREHWSRVSLPQFGAALDVAEKKRHDPCWRGVRHGGFLFD